MLAARDDELIAPPQLFAVEHLIGTPAHDVRKATAPCRHVGLFMGERTLAELWPEIARWVRATRFRSSSRRGTGRVAVYA
jgi:hypothetical protein